MSSEFQVDGTGTVQLTGACLPRTAKLPYDTETTETGDFAVLAPEVLCGEKYEAFADIYAFGLLILELVQVDMPVVFRDQRRMTLCDFIRTVNPEEMLGLHDAVEVFTNKTRALIINCLEIEKTFRPQIIEVVRYADFIKSETDALAKFPSRRSRGPIKRPSMDIGKKGVYM